MREGRRRGRGRGGRKQDKHFMDVAKEGYVRDMALEKWREIDDTISTLHMTLRKAVVEAARFTARGPYENLWKERWQAELLKQGGLKADNLMQRIEVAVKGALNDEMARRSEQGQPSIEDTPHYIAFVARAMETLLEDSEGEIEEFDEEEL